MQHQLNAPVTGTVTELNVTEQQQVEVGVVYAEAGKLGYLSINLPAEYGDGGGGRYRLAIVEEEFGVTHLHPPPPPVATATTGYS